MEMENFLNQAHRLDLEWYKQADSKAQIVLGFTGIFLSIVVGSLLSRPPDSRLSRCLAEHHGCFVLLLFAMTLYVATVSLSAWALWSRGVFGESAAEKGIHFLGHIADYTSAEDFKKAIVAVMGDPEGGLNALIQEVHILAQNTKRKHRLVNIAVLLAGCALAATMVLGLITFLL